MALWPPRRRSDRRAAGPGTKTLFFATDLHGSEMCYRKFLAAARFYGADLLVLGGDITGKLVVPVVECGRGRYRATMHGRTHELDERGVSEFEEEARRVGFYPRRLTAELHDACASDARAVERMFEESIVETLERWIDLAEERLADTEVGVVFIAGNDDPEIVDEVVRRRASPRFRFVEGEIVEVAPGHEMLCTGYTNVTPWATPREYPEEVIRDHVESMASRLRQPETAVFNIHVPPHRSRLDTAPLVGQDLKVKTSLGQQVTGPVGSTAVRAAIEKYQPLLSLHGHIHESSGAVRLGRTLAINPGSDYGEGVLRGALVTIGGGRVHRYQLTQG